MKNQSRSKSNAGPTPFRRRSSYFAHDPKQKSNWLLYDNDGSFNGWFDWLPLWMRVGPWNPLVVLTLVVVYTSLIKFKPELQFEEIALANLDEEGVEYFGMPKETAIDLALFLWGFVVILHAKVTLGSIGAFPMSFTGWSWLLLTFRAGFEFTAWTTAKHYQNLHLASKLAMIGSSIRLVAVTNACVVCTIWNFILLPIIYFKSMPPGEKRQNFLKFNFGFFMTNIHLLNFPMSCMNILNGNRTRLFTESGKFMVISYVHKVCWLQHHLSLICLFLLILNADLWVSYLVIVLYSLVYYFIMDRVGLHFYPIINPRTAWTLVSIVFILGLYYMFFLKWNEYLLV